MYAGHLDFAVPLTKTIENVVTEDESRVLIEKFETHEFEKAPIHDLSGGEAIDLAVRNNDRIMYFDEEFAHVLFSRVFDQLPDSIDGSPVVSVNDYLRLYRYESGQRHGAHWDTPVVLDDVESKLTFVVYLNDDFEGGETDFPELEETIVPVRGLALLFQQRVLHEARPVTRGTKYVLRSEIMITKP